MKCGWCDKEAVGNVTLAKGTKKKPPKQAPVCKDHQKIVDWQQPFYTCGCSYVEGEFKCPRHLRLLRSPWKEKLSKVSIKHSNVEKRETKGFVVK